MESPRIIIADYWFKIEPYVFIGITDKCALLYNTLDGVSLESSELEVVELLREILQEENQGVVLLKNERYNRKGIQDFIMKLRENFMGDVIDVSLSNGKPVQMLPFFNYFKRDDIYKKLSFSVNKGVLNNLLEISIHVNGTSDLSKLISTLNTLPQIERYNLVGNIKEVANYKELLLFLDRKSTKKCIFCSYTDVIWLQPEFENNFSYKISVRFPIDKQQWNHSRHMLLKQTLPFDYVFDISSKEDYVQAEQIIDQFQIEKYQLNPVYTGENIQFFEENVFLTKEDILSVPLTMKDFFVRQAMNPFDFGKINIMPNGDVYANVNHPVLGNIYTHSIYEIVCEEMEHGTSWFNIRHEGPCSNCIYQWLCPPPSHHEIAIGRPDLCHINNKMLTNDREYK